MRRFLFAFAALLFLQFAKADTLSTCPFVKMTAERLPDLHTPRSGHQTMLVGNEVTVFGGHTRGYVLTPTAEYFSEGRWHQLEMVYAHDNGLAVLLTSDSVLLAGGHEKNLGIGQSFEVEMYCPQTHTFEGFGCLDQKRAMAEGVQMADGQVAVSGNWYGDDGIEMFDPGCRKFRHVKDASVSRSYVHLLRIGDDEALVFSNMDRKGEPFDSVTVDRLKGEPFSVPLLREWRSACFPNSSVEGFIGDMSKGDYAYLMADKNDAGQLAIIEIRDTLFALLPTNAPIPVAGISGDTITYIPCLIADREAGRGYVVGTAPSCRYYVLAIDYQQRPAPITLFYTDPQAEQCVVSGTQPVLTPEGNLLICGGIQESNFQPLRSAWLLRVGAAAPEPSLSQGMLLAIVIATLASLALALYVYRTRRGQKVAATGTGANTEVLMQRINEVMQSQRLFLNSELRLEDVAKAIGTNRTALSNCINSHYGGQFKQFVNKYRVAYAQQLMLEKPDRKMLDVWTQSGFASESGFFRTFKAVTGLSPLEWKKLHTG